MAGALTATECKQSRPERPATGEPRLRAVPERHAVLAELPAEERVGALDERREVHEPLLRIPKDDAHLREALHFMAQDLQGLAELRLLGSPTVQLGAAPEPLATGEHHLSGFSDGDERARHLG